MYFHTVVFCVGEFDEVEFKKQLSRYDNDFKDTYWGDIQSPSEFYDGRTWYVDDYVIIHCEDLGVSKVTHEILHGVFYIARRIGIEPSKDSEEFYTYMMGYLVKEFYNYFKK